MLTINADNIVVQLSLTQSGFVVSIKIWMAFVKSHVAMLITIQL